MAEWKKYTLQDLATIKYGKNQKAVVSQSGTIPIFGTGGLMGYATKPLYSEPSVLIGRKGTIEKVHYVTEPFWTVDTLFYTIINKELVTPYFFYCLMQLVDLKKLNEGTTIPSLRTETLNRLTFNVPPLSTQKKIAEVLSCLDAKIELNRRINENLEQQAQAIFKEWFVDNAKPEWKVGKLGEFAKVKGGKRLPKGKNLTSEKTSHPYIRIRDLNNTSIVYLSENFEYVDDDTQKVISRYIVHSKDVLLSIVGTIGLTVLVDDSLDSANLTENCVKITELKDLFPEYIFLYLKSDVGQNEIKKRTVGAVQQKLPIKNIEDIPILVPDRETINIVAPIISALFSDVSKNLLQSQILAQIRDTLLPKLMNGEIEV